MTEKTTQPTKKTPPVITPPVDMSSPTSTIGTTNSSNSNPNSNSSNATFGSRQNNNYNNYNNNNNRNRSYNGSKQTYSKNYNNNTNNSYNYSYNKNSSNGYSRYTNMKVKSNNYNNNGIYTASAKNNANRFNNGSRFNSSQYYLNNNHNNPNLIIPGNEDMMNQPHTNMAWSGYYIPQMYYIPQHMAVATAMVSGGTSTTKNNRGQMNISNRSSENSSNASSHVVSPQLNTATINSPLPAVVSERSSDTMAGNNNNNIDYNVQNISSNDSLSPGLSTSRQSASPQRKTTIEITTKSGQKLDLNKIHSQYKSSSASTTNNERDIHAKSNPNEALSKEDNANKIEGPNETHDGAHDNETNNNNSSSKNVESEAEKNKRSFLEQVRLRKLEMDKKKKLESHPPPETKDNKIENDSTKEDIVAVSKEESQIQVSNKLEGQETEHIMTFAEKMKLKKRTQEMEQFESSSVEHSNQQDGTSKLKSEQSEQKDEDTAAKPLNDNETNIPISKLEDNEEHTPTNDENHDNEDDDRMSITDFIKKLENTKSIEDIYSFKYPENVEPPNEKYKRAHIKYTYGPTFLLQFKDKINCKPDKDWTEATRSRIVILPSMSKQRSRVNFAGGSENTRAGSSRNFDSRANSRVNSKRQSSKRVDERKSNRSSYTPRRERMDISSRHDTRREYTNVPPQEKPEPPKEEVAPLVPSANRWVPKFKTKKTEKKLAPDGVTELLDSEEVQRKMKSLLNKLTLEKFDAISTDILSIANQSQWETNGETLRSVIEQIFLKACDEPYWSSMYAQLCGKIVKDLKAEITDENNLGKSGPKLVLHYLVVRCHTEFEKGWTDKLPTNPDGSPLEPEMMSDEYYALAAAKRRGLGLVRFIGFLYRLNLLTGKMMFECFRRLMKDLTENVSEETLESLVELLTTVGKQFEDDSFSTGKGTLEGSVLFDKLFQLIQSIIDEGKISSRVKFKLIDVKELREDKNWNSEKANQGPKTIQQIHEEEEKARQEKAASSRAPSRRNNTSTYNRSERSSGFKRDMSRDNFSNNYYSSNTISNNYSNRNSQFSNVGSTQRYNTRNVIKEEKPAPTQPINRFDALLHAAGDE